jgi:hypothetical protein
MCLEELQAFFFSLGRKCHVCLEERTRNELLEDQQSRLHGYHTDDGSLLLWVRDAWSSPEVINPRLLSLPPPFQRWASPWSC